MKEVLTDAKLKFLAHKALEIRIDVLKATTEAGSGHPTSCFSAADIVAALFFHTLHYDFQKPAYPNNDRFILSKGHAVPVLYAALQQHGTISTDELLSYRKINSNLEGHPTPRFIFNEAATGSLGQGLSIGLGMALNAQHDNLPYQTYVLLGDGEIAEGSVWEAAELASHYNIDNLTGIADCNKLGQSDNALHIHKVERYAKKFEAFGWKTFVIDGHNLKQIVQTLDDVQKVKGQPCMIVAKTIKGYGIDDIEGKLGYHGKPFSKDVLPQIIERLKKRFKDAVTQPTDFIFTPQKPNLVSETSKSEEIPSLNFAQEKYGSTLSKCKKIATRKAFGRALADLGSKVDSIFVLDGDVKNSTFTEIFEKENPNRFIQCFIAEQNMIGVASGLALRGKIPFVSTFGAFFSRCFDQVRMAGVGRVPLRLCGSHSGVSIGQDGPSQMGLEDLGMMRSIPQSIIFWPCDGISTYKLTEVMTRYNKGISYMKTTRMDTPLIYDKNETFEIGGCKVLRSSDQDKACLIAAGITVYEALKAHDILKQQNILVSVIDLYSIKPLDISTLTKVARASGNTIVTVQDHYPEGGVGEAVAASLASEGNIRLFDLAIDKLPRSGTPEELLKFEEIDAESIVKKITSILS